MIVKNLQIHYLLGINENVIAALQCQPTDYEDHPGCAVDYVDEDGKVTEIHCYILREDADLQLTAIDMQVLAMKYIIPNIKLLARRGAEDEQYENVCAIYKFNGPDANDPEAETGFAEFARPQDFATRHLHDSGWYAWKYRLINYIVIDDSLWQNYQIKPKTGKSYIVNAYIDVPHSDAQMIHEFASVFPLMSMKGSAYDVIPMRPTDCLKEYDFWDKDVLGDPPSPCPKREDFFY